MNKGEIYHIFNRGNNRETIFKEERNYVYFLEKFKQYLSEYVSVHAYCLMPNHFHFLIEIKDLQNTEQFTEAAKFTKVSKTFANSNSQH